MAGLNFQSQTIINSNLDPNSGKDVVLFSAADECLNIKRDYHFYKDKAGYGKVCCIRKRAGYDAKLCKAIINFDPIKDALNEEGNTYFRLDLYLGVEGASPFIYGIQSPNEVLKGIPFWVEFTGKKGDSAAKLAEKVAKLIKKNCVFQCDKDLINVEVDNGTIVLEGATEYQRFKKIEISKFDATDDYADVVIEMDSNPSVAAQATDVKLVERGENSFGTYSQIVKDLRLLTAANYQPYHIRQVETPIIGAIYNQYIIEYCAPAVNDGLHFVGQRGESNTVHVFWVKNDPALIAEWEAALATVGTIEDVDATEAPAPVVPGTDEDGD